MTWIAENFELIASLTLVHLRQSLVALGLGFAISLALGWVAWRVEFLRSPLVTATGLMYTIPSLALLMILPAATGMSAISESNLIAALVVYAVAILLRSVVDGLESVGPEVRQAAIALGYGPARRFAAVELPLAGPVILSGLRVTAVSTISLATVGILVGVTNLGYLFTNGLQRRIIPEVFSGILAVAVVALAIDLLLVLIGRALMPWTRPSAAKRRSLSPHTAEAGEAS